MSRPRGGAWLAIASLAAVLVIAVLTMSRGFVWYDELSYRRFAATVRRVVPRRIPVALLPLAVPGATSLHLASTPWGAAALLIGSISMAEVYVVCLHREAWIAAFEPWLLDLDLKPLGGRPTRPEDRRLHQLFRLQVLYLPPLLAAGLLVGLGQPLYVLALALFMVKYFTHASTDFEVVWHWDLHTRVLDMTTRPWLASFWRGLGNTVLSPFLGYAPSTYQFSHLKIHHRENAGPDDLHSPVGYRRTSILEFSVFACRVVASTFFGVDVARHPRICGPDRMRIAAGVFAMLGTLGLLLSTERSLGLFVLLFTLQRGVSTARSQYVWHALYDPNASPRPEAGTILWLPHCDVLAVPALADVVRPAGGVVPRKRVDDVPEAGTDWAFFDNYHLIHHRHARAHFSEYPNLLRRELPGLIERGACVMALEGLPQFAYNCWTGNIAAIAADLLTPMGFDDREAYLTERLLPMASCRSRVAAIWELRLAERVEQAARRTLGVLTGGR